MCHVSFFCSDKVGWARWLKVCCPQGLVTFKTIKYCLYFSFFYWLLHLGNVCYEYKIIIVFFLYLFKGALVTSVDRCLWQKMHMKRVNTEMLKHNITILSCLSLVWVKYFQRLSIHHSTTNTHYCYKWNKNMFELYEFFLLHTCCNNKVILK